MTTFALNIEHIRSPKPTPREALWECAIRQRQRLAKNLLIHIAKFHTNAKRRAVTCPYCPYTLRYIGDLKVHRQLNKCANVTRPISPQTWIDVETTNPELPEIRIQGPPADYIASMETYFGRLTTEYDDEGRYWQCAKCIYRHNR